MKNKLVTAVALVYLFISHLNVYAQNRPSVDSLYRRLEQASDTEKANLLNELSSRFHYTDTKKSNELADQALELSRKIHYPIGEAYALNCKGMNYDYSGQLKQSLECFLAALKIVEDRNKPVLTALILSNIGNVYFYQPDIEKAVQYWEQSLVILEKTGSPRDIGARLINLGAAYGRLKKYDAAQKAYDRALAIFTKENDTKNIAAVYLNMGILIHRKEEAGKNAVPYYLKAMELSKELKDADGQLTAGMNLAQAYAEVPEYPKAIAMMEECLTQAKSTHYMAAIVQIYEALAEMYTKTNDYKKAYGYMQQFVSARDSMLNESSQKQILELETKYKTSRKEKEIKEKEVELEKNRNKIFVLTIVIILISFSALFIILILRRKKVVATELEKAKSKFFSNIAHEFRTPVALITGPIEHVLQETQDTQLKKKLSIPLRNARYLVRLINELIDVSKLESGVMKVHEVYGDVGSFAGELVEHLTPMAYEKSVELSYQAPVDDINVYFDGDSLEKIIYNLVTNAIKFTPSGGVVEVSLTDRKDSDVIVLTVKDTGIGISAKDQQELFSRFFRSNDVQAIPGIGLGLSLVKELVALNNGNISVKSTQGKGSEFVVALPVKRLATAAPLPDDDENEAMVAVVIEDNPDMLSFISSVLADNGITVVQCAEGNTGLEQVRAVIPDIVITDLMLPDTDGYEICNTIKNDLATDHIPVIMLTAKASAERRVEALGKGADVYLSKPFNPQELTGYINNLLSLRRNILKKYTTKPEEDAATVAVSTIESLKAMNNKFIDSVVVIIEKNLADENFSVDILSKEVFLSRAQFHRKLKVLTGFAASILIRTIRLERALELLKKDAGSVTEIAFLTGFNSQPYFSKCFTEHFGYSPKEVKPD